ncbi:hypothetical protein PsYK624_127940 [Phanerochaete sordida]|uniref:Uncharacterized protein n=1 Tax=Phanerochaete sordida TaxID=48140 RepID=A0A9P3LIR0_9APHY|nr:hypothetical protein PsYK624_127940 [Phanerochaete sordida]
MSLPRSAFRPATASSDESSIASPRTPTGPSESPFVRVRQGPSHSQHFRDSIVSSSTSLYPKSTSSDSDFESSFPRSPKKRGRDFGPDAIGQADFDVDDVSYRLRLLVHNSYFLPPAHSKPSPLSLAPPKLPADHKRTSTSGFLDFFRKAKSKPTTPLCLSPPAVDDLQGPILRTTSDSTTASGHVPRLQSHSTPVTPLNKPATQPSASRVVVLREQMDDLLEAARQAERDLKTKGDGRKAKSQETTHERDLFDDVVDPTDIVDLPPPPASYPFPVQTSALHGLGPGESLGADFLADRLPPSPGIWSMSSEESSWRRAILQEAVSLSLSPKTSLISMSPKSQEMQSPTSGSFRSDTSDKPAETESTPTTRVLPLIGQRIIEPSIVGADKDETRTLSPLSALQGLQSTSPLLRGVAASPELLSSAWKGPQLPGRAETPAAMLPLTPPPFRKHLSHPQISAVVEAAKAGSPEPDAGRDSLSVIRKVVSSPGLGSLHERHKAAFAAGAPGESIESRLDRLGMFSPTFREDKSEGEPSQHTRPSTSMRETPFTDDDDLSYVTPGDIDDGAPRPSMTLSIPTVGRPSMDDSDDNPSPTASAFQDAVFGSYRAPSPLLFRRSYIGAIGAQPSSPSRANVTSPPPPPRTSSSVDATNLPPPPRAPGPKPIFTRPSTSSGRSTHSSLPMHSAVEEPEPESEVDPEFSPSTITSQPYSPTSPRSLSARRGRQSGLSLLIPTDFATPAIHSAPAPASPTAFFDRIQSHPNAMDDLETSEESDTESLVTAGEADAPVQAPPPLPKQLESFIPKPASARTSIASSRSSRSARPSFMRLGNHSSPHLTPGAARDDAASVLSFDVPDRRVPIGYIAPRDAPASRWKKGKGAAPPPLPRREDEPAPGPSRIPRLASTRRPATAGGGAPGPAPRQRASIQRFDSLLQEHIASERDTLKRITTNISNASRRP